MTRMRRKVSALHPARLTRRLVRRRTAKPAGLAPGTVVYTGERREGPASLSLLRYQGDDITEEDIAVDALTGVSQEHGVTWIQFCGVHDVDAVQQAGEAFGLHPLTQEDIVNTEHRAKIEQFDDYLVVILRHLRLDDEFTLSEDNVSLILTRNVVLSFSLGAQEIFEPNRERINAAHGRFRARGADYLFYTLIDSVVDHYVNILTTVDDRIALLEEEIIEHPSRETIAHLHDQRRILLTLRKAVLPLREVLIQMQREETEMIGEDITMFLHDVQDHVMHVLDTIESNRDAIGGLLDLAIAHESNRMNEVMKVLTIIATVFIPLTFIAGVYGMNFEYMPELRIPWAYPAVLLFMLLVGIVMFVFFKRRHWL